jgi:signal recognition particle GTPase
MSQETPIGSLGGGNTMNQEDSHLVDSILNDLNSGSQPQQQQQQQQRQQVPVEEQRQRMSPEQEREMLEHRHHEMMQQQMMQQQMMMQQQQKEQNGQSESILEKLQSEWKNILIIVVLSVVINTSIVDDLFKINDNSYFIQENGSLNMQAVIIKALLIGVAFFLINMGLSLSN